MIFNLGLTLIIPLVSETAMIIPSLISILNATGVKVSNVLIKKNKSVNTTDSLPGQNLYIYILYMPHL